MARKLQSLGGERLFEGAREVDRFGPETSLDVKSWKLEMMGQKGGNGSPVQDLPSFLGEPTKVMESPRAQVYPGQISPHPSGFPVHSQRPTQSLG